MQHARVKGHIKSFEFAFVTKNMVPWLHSYSKCALDALHYINHLIIHSVIPHINFPNILSHRILIQQIKIDILNLSNKSFFCKLHLFQDFIKYSFPISDLLFSCVLISIFLHRSLCKANIDL